MRPRWARARQTDGDHHGDHRQLHVSAKGSRVPRCQPQDVTAVTRKLTQGADIGLRCWACRPRQKHRHAIQQKLGFNDRFSGNDQPVVAKDQHIDARPQPFGNSLGKRQARPEVGNECASNPN